MNKDELIKKEYEKLKNIYKNSDPIKLQLCDDLLNKAAFLKIELRLLESGIKRTGAIQHSTKGNTRVAITYKTYLQTLSVYQSVIKSVDKIMANTGDVEDDAFDEFLKKAKEGES